MASTMCFFASLILSAVPIVSANPGQVVAQVPHGAEGQDIFGVLERAYEKFHRTIVAKSQDDWNRMSAQDFAKFDAVLAVNYETNCNYTDYNPFSNSEEWGSAVSNGNTIILATEELAPTTVIDKESLDVIEAAAGYSLYDPNNTGAYISLGWMYHKCFGDDPTNATWLDTAFQVEEKNEQTFEIQKVRFGSRSNLVVSSHPALTNLTNSTFMRRNRRPSAKAAFTKYPSDFSPYAISLSLDNKPFILLKESKHSLTGNPSFSPTNLPILKPTASSTSIPSATPSKSASVRLSARPATSSTKRPSIGYQIDLASCPDNADFYVNNDASKTCQWIGLKASRLRNLCAKEYVAINCPSTCEMDCNSGSPSFSPTKLPALTPTASPTSIPSTTPSQSASVRLSAHPTTSSTERPRIVYQHDFPMSVHFINVPLTNATATSTAPSSVPKTSAPFDAQSKKKGKASRKKVKKIAKNLQNRIIATKKSSKAQKMEKKHKRKSSKA